MKIVVWAAKWILILGSVLSGTVYAAVVQRKSASEVNLYISGSDAGQLYDHLAIGVPEDRLPNGSFLEGGNVGCVRIGTDTNCALNLRKDGFTSEKTPRMDTNLQSAEGDLVVTKMSDLGLMHLTLSKQAAEEIFNALQAVPDAEGRKLGSNILCSPSSPGTSCSFLVNQRGFADFPQSDLD